MPDYWTWVTDHVYKVLTLGKILYWAPYICDLMGQIFVTPSVNVSSHKSVLSFKSFHLLPSLLMN